MAELRHQDNNVLDFLASSGYIRFDPAAYATSKDLFRAYHRWCEDNVEKPFSERTFCTILRSNETRLGMIYDKNLDGGAGKSARGYRGVSVFINVLDYLRG